MNYYMKYILQKCMAAAIKPLYIFPVRKKRILFLSLEGGSRVEYACNPKYFYEYLKSHHPGEYQYVWLFKDPEAFAELKGDGTLLEKHFTLKGFYYALTSEFVITNGGYGTWFPFRRSQHVINTWHGGGAYKKLENDTAGAGRISRKRMEYMADHTEAFVSSSTAFTNYMIHGAFCFDGTVLPYGSLRNDILFSPAARNLFNARIREQFRLPTEAGLLLYAPTFRSAGDTGFVPLRVSALLDALTEASGRPWFFLYRMHIQAGTPQALLDMDERSICVSDYPDTQELLCAADMMISDFSSIIWDFCLTGRPLALYVPDLENYISSRGFYIDIHDWGFPLLKDQEALTCELLSHLQEKEYLPSLQHREHLGSCESGQACELLYHYLRQTGKR